MSKISKLDLIFRASAICKTQQEFGPKVLLFTNFGILECEIDNFPDKPIGEIPNESLIRCALAIKEDPETRESIMKKEDAEKDFILIKNVVLFSPNGRNINIESMIIFLDSVEAVSVGHMHLN